MITERTAVHAETTSGLAAQLYRAELALHDAEQTGDPAWIAAAAARLVAVDARYAAAVRSPAGSARAAC